MDGNPKPSLDFEWPHLSGSLPTNVPSVDLFSFIYASNFSLNNINASYCGRILKTATKTALDHQEPKIHMLLFGVSLFDF